MNELKLSDYPASAVKKAFALAKRIGYEYENPLYLMEALTHASFANEHREKRFPYNERIEFMGDSVLNFCVTGYIYRHYPDLDEGALTKLRSGVVCDAALYEYGVALGLDECLLLGHGERQGGVIRRSIISDATEALFASLFLDGGLEFVRGFILSIVTDKIRSLVEHANLRDHKSLLHELVQTEKGAVLEYVLLSESGPDHDKTFETEVRLNGNPMGRGVGRSKRESEQAAAGEALKFFDV